MDIRKLQRAIVDGLEDVKAQNIVVFNTEHLSSLFERVIIASGTSNRQTKALASSVRDAVKARGLQVMRTEGEDNGEWIIVDCGAAVAHIMQPAIRDYYHLEEIWGGKPVKMKLGAAGPSAAARAAASIDEDDEDAPAVPAPRPARAGASKAPARKAASRMATGDKASADKAAPAKAAPRKPAARKPAAGAAIDARPARPARKAAPRKTAARKPAAA